MPPQAPPLTDPNLATDSADEVLGKAEAFMRRARPAPPARTEDDVPVLTDIVPALDQRLSAAAQAAIGAPPPRPTPAPASSPPRPQPSSVEQDLQARLAQALREQRHALGRDVEEWVNFGLPGLIRQEFEAANDRIIRRALEEVREILYPESGGKP